MESITQSDFWLEEQSDCWRSSQIQRMWGSWECARVGAFRFVNLQQKSQHKPPICDIVSKIIIMSFFFGNEEEMELYYMGEAAPGRL
jgi:hypothetical protein